MIIPLVALAVLTLSECVAQVPKPPWAGETASNTGSKPEAETAPAESSDTTFKVDVKLVNVFVTVTDANGAPIAGLNKEDFTILENDKEQKVALFGKESALPLSIVMQIDTSLSTRKIYRWSFPRPGASPTLFCVRWMGCQSTHSARW